MKNHNNLIFTFNTNSSYVDSDPGKIHHIFGSKRRNKKEVEMIAGDRDVVYFLKRTSLRLSHLSLKTENVMDVL